VNCCITLTNPIAIEVCKSSIPAFLEPHFTLTQP